MSDWRQSSDSVAGSPFVYIDGVVNSNYPVGVLEIEDFGSGGGTVSVQVVLIAVFEGKTLCAVPESVWSRQVAKRVLPQTALQRPQLIEVQSCFPSDPDTAVAEYTLKLWVGYLRAELVTEVEFLEECNFDYLFDTNEEITLMPFAQALVDVSQEHFAYFSAAEAPPETMVGEEIEDKELDGEELLEDELQAELVMQGAGSPVASRLSKVEDTVTNIMKELRMIRQGQQQAAPKKQTRAKAKAVVATKVPSGSGKPTTSTSPNSAADLKAKCPFLDVGVVNAALKLGFLIRACSRCRRL